MYLLVEVQEVIGTVGNNENEKAKLVYKEAQWLNNLLGLRFQVLKRIQIFQMFLLVMF